MVSIEKQEIMSSLKPTLWCQPFCLKLIHGFFKQVWLMKRAYSNAHAIVKLLDVVKQQTLDSNAVAMEDTNVWHRLELAFALRESPVYITKQVQITYTLMREWMSFQIITSTTTRPWGMPNDLQELAHGVAGLFPLGVIVLNHDNKQAFRFSLSDPPSIIPASKAIRYAAKFAKCLVLARVAVPAGGHVFARLTARYIPLQDRSVANANMLEFLLARSLRAPTLPWLHREPMSATSLLDGNDDGV